MLPFAKGKEVVPVIFAKNATNQTDTAIVITPEGIMNLMKQIPVNSKFIFTRLLLQIRHSLAIGFLVNHAVTIEGFAAFFVTGKGTDQVRVLDIFVHIAGKGLSCRMG